MRRTVFGMRLVSNAVPFYIELNNETGQTGSVVPNMPPFLKRVAKSLVFFNVISIFKDTIFRVQLPNSPSRGLIF